MIQWTWLSDYKLITKMKFILNESEQKNNSSVTITEMSFDILQDARKSKPIGKSKLKQQTQAIYNQNVLGYKQQRSKNR